jgi:hypothetical protein
LLASSSRNRPTRRPDTPLYMAWQQLVKGWSHGEIVSGSPRSLDSQRPYTYSRLALAVHGWRSIEEMINWPGTLSLLSSIIRFSHSFQNRIIY